MDDRQIDRQTARQANRQQREGEREGCIYIYIYIYISVCVCHISIYTYTYMYITWPSSTPFSGLRALRTLSMSCSELVEGSANHWRRLSVAFQLPKKIKYSKNRVLGYMIQ